MRKRLTSRTIETLKPASTGRRLVMDTDVPGFGVKVTEKGSRSFILLTRFPGFKNPTPRQLGMCGVMTLEQARQRARE